MEIKVSTSFEKKYVYDKPGVVPEVKLLFTPLEKEIILPGAVLEAQYLVGEYYIVFTTEGATFEETLFISFLDGDTKLLDSLELSAIFTPGILTDLRIELPNTLCFAFFDDNECWALEIYPKPKIELWARGYIVKRKYPLLHKSYMRLTER